MSSPLALCRTAAVRLQRNMMRFAGVDALTGSAIDRSEPIERLGSRGCGWQVPAAVLKPGAVCYCAGAGEDISFDLTLAETYHCEVYTFDPTPRAVAYVRRIAAHVERLRLVEVGLWDTDEILKFYAPENPAHVSHSVLNLQRTERYFEARCRPLADLMGDFGHTHIDVLKLDIEGAEYRVIRAMLDRGLDVRVLCVEFDEAGRPLDRYYKARIRDTSARLLSHGYALVAQEGAGNYTFMRRT